jgi:PKD repeat protein
MNHNRKKITIRNSQLFFFLAILNFTLFYSCKKKEEPAPLATASFTFDGTSKPAPVFVQFRNNSANAVSYFWDFGDGTTSTELSPKHQFKNSSAYSISLTVQNIDGVTNMVSKPYIVLPAYTIFRVTKITLTTCPIPFPITMNSTFVTSLPHTLNINNYNMNVNNSSILFEIGSAGGSQFIEFTPADYILPNADNPYPTTINVNKDGYVYTVEGTWY